MGQVQQRILRAAPCAALLLATTVWAGDASSRPRFYPDDPLLQDARPIDVKQMRTRKISDYYDLFHHLLATPGERQKPGAPVRAQSVNTLDEVPDGAWYTNRHYKRPMSLEELRRGPDTGGPPVSEGVWKVIRAKTEGVTPGFLIEDAKKRQYFLKFDPEGHQEMATACDVIGSKFFYALGYHVPENYIVTFRREQLQLGTKVTVLDRRGKVRPMTSMDLFETLSKAPEGSDGRFRAVASRFLPGEPVGPFRYYGTRRDDPNDVVPHEHRRELRGLYVFAAWLGHEDSRAVNSLDTIVEENGSRYLKHSLIDFGSILGSASDRPNSPREGYEYLFSWKPAAVEFFTLGLYVPSWARAHYPNLPSVGRFESAKFDPDRFRPEYPNPAFNNRLPDDTFWGAKQVMAFSDEQIRVMVETGQYSDRAAVDWLVKCMVERRDKIGRTFFAQVLPLDRFGVRDGKLVFDDLAVQHKLAPARTYRIEWARFDNRTRGKNPLAGHSGPSVPQVDGPYLAAEIRGDDAKKSVTVYLVQRNRTWEVVGVERFW